MYQHSPTTPSPNMGYYVNNNVGRGGLTSVFNDNRGGVGAAIQQRKLSSTEGIIERAQTQLKGKRVSMVKTEEDEMDEYLANLAKKTNTVKALAAGNLSDASDLSMSTPSEVTLSTPRPGGATEKCKKFHNKYLDNNSSSKKKQEKIMKLTSSLSLEDEDGTGGGKRFLKKKSTPSPTTPVSPPANMRTYTLPETPVVNLVGEESESPGTVEGELALARDYNNSSSDDEELKKFILGMSDSELRDVASDVSVAHSGTGTGWDRPPAPSPPKSPSGRKEVRFSSQLAVADETSAPLTDVSIDTSLAIEGFYENVMGIDDLQSAIPGTTNRPLKSSLKPPRPSGEGSQDNIETKSELSDDNSEILGVILSMDDLEPVEVLEKEVIPELVSKTSNNRKQVGKDNNNTKTELNNSRRRRLKLSHKNSSDQSDKSQESSIDIVKGSDSRKTAGKSRTKHRRSSSDSEGLTVSDQSSIPEEIGTNDVITRPESAASYTTDSFDDVSTRSGDSHTTSSSTYTNRSDNHSESDSRSRSKDDTDSEVADLPQDRDDLRSSAPSVESVPSYTETFTTYTSSSVVSKPVTRSDRSNKGKSSTTDQAVQVDDNLIYTPLSYRWGQEAGISVIHGAIGHMPIFDPTPIAPAVIPQQQLDKWASYNPCLIALQDMMRYQLQITRQFMENTKLIHDNYITSLQPTHQYTTLEETKHFIKKNRKPRLTFEKAMKQVEEEMGQQFPKNHIKKMMKNTDES